MKSAQNARQIKADSKRRAEHERRLDLIARLTVRRAEKGIVMRDTWS
jgi:hypothetical protein